MLAVRRLVVALTPALVLGCTPKGNPDPIVVVYLAPLSGPERTIGEHGGQGIDLAVEDANQEGNRVANRPVHVVHTDIAGGPDVVRAQTVRDITLRHPAALLGGAGASQLEQIGRAAEPYGLPLISPGPLAAAPVGDYLFSSLPAPACQGQILARLTREVLKPAGVFVLADGRGDVGGSLAAAFAKEVGQGNAVKVEESSYRGEADFPGLVDRVKKARPKAVLVAGTATDLRKLWPQLHAAAPDAALLFGGDEGGGPALTGDTPCGGTAYVVSAFAVEALTTKGKDVARQYRERFGADLDAPGALAYDDARLLFEAMRRSTSSLLVRKELLGLDNFEGLTGPFAFTKEHTARRPLFVLRIEDGKTSLAKRYDPEAK